MNITTMFSGRRTLAVAALLGLAAVASGASVNGTIQKDVMAKERFPDTNFGTDVQLQVSAQAGFQKIIYVQFSVANIPVGATGITAQLKLRSQTSATQRPITAHAVAGTAWSETGLTWNNKPALGATLSTVSTHTAGADSVWDVSGQVTGNGTFALGLNTTFAGDTTFDSREGTTAPRLVVSYTPAGGLPIPDHVVIVIEENHAYEQIYGSSAAPYINSLANSGALFTQSFAIEHPSQPNYLDLFSGSNQGITDDTCPHNFTTPNLGAQLLQNSLSFVGYAESLPSAGSTVCTATNYARKHAPWVDWQGAAQNGISPVDNQPFSSFPIDFTTLPTVSIVVPNLVNDMHNGTDPSRITSGDTWLKNHLDAYAQWAKTHNSLLIVTFDEDDHNHSNHILTFMVGAMVKSGVYAEHIDHYDLLRTIEDMYALPHAGNAATATAITDCWK